MIPGLKHRTTEYKISEDCIFTVHEPDLFYTMDEADEICKNLRKQGYHCGVIYQYRHRGIGKRYIGQTMCPKKRHLSHLASVRNCKINSAWHQALKKYSIKWFDYQILAIILDRNEQHFHELLDERETYFIANYHSSVKQYGYNVASGGTKRPGKSTIEKAVDMFDMDGNYIKTFSSLTKASANFGFTGPTIRQVCNHIHQSAGGYLWAWTGECPIVPSENKIYAYDENGQYATEYSNVFSASKQLGKSQGNIWCALKDKYRMAYGMYWRTYKIDQIPLSDFPKAVFAYNKDGDFVRGFINLAKAKEFTGDYASSSISHAISRKIAHKGYLWRKEYSKHIDPANGRRQTNKSVEVC